MSSILSIFIKKTNLVMTHTGTSGIGIVMSCDQMSWLSQGKGVVIGRVGIICISTDIQLAVAH